VDLIVDANVIFAALIRDSITAKLLFVDDLHLYTPEFLLDEVKKYHKYLSNKTHRTKEEFESIYNVIKKRIVFIPMDFITPFIEKADKVSPDPDDSVYFAVALKMNISIWSNDKRLTKQDVVKIYATHDLYEIYKSQID
jgi:predicted nucleic acid-binding protein